MTQWSSRDIPWDAFDPARVGPDILKVVKAAAMVEKNSADYATYLRNIFHDDQVLQNAFDRWAEEEEQHGDVIGRWAEMADADFNFAERFNFGNVLNEHNFGEEINRIGLWVHCVDDGVLIGDSFQVTALRCL